MTTLFWLFKSRANSRGEAPIVMRITHNKKRVNIGLEVRVHPSSWDEKKQRVRGQSDFASTTNALLSTCKTNVLKAYDVLLQKNITFSARDILDVYWKKRSI